MTNRDKFCKGLGMAIHRGRTGLQMSTAYLADILSVSRTTVVQWEAGKQSPTTGRIPDIAETLGMTTPELVKLACKLGGCQ